MANQYELVYKLGAEVSSQFMSSFNKASNAVKEMSGAIGGLTGKSADVSKLVKLRQAAESSSKAYEKQRAVVENLKKNVDSLHGSDSKMVKLLESETVKLEKAKQTMLSQSRAAEELSKKLKMTGVSTADLERKQEKLTKAMDRVNKIQAKINRVNAIQSSTDQAAMSSAIMVGVLARKAVSMFQAPVQSAMEMEQVMQNLKDTLDIKSPEGLIQLQRTFEDMSLSVPIAKENLAAMMALAKQNGMSGDLAKFTENAAKFATVLKIEGTEAVSMFTDWNAKLSQTTEETFQLANATVALSNHNANFAKSIGQTVLQVGEYAKRAGLAEKQTAAIAAAMVSTGSSAEDAAMGIRQMLKVMGSGDAMSKGQIGAFQALGLGDPKKLQESLQKDASGVMLNVLRKVRDTIPQSQQLSLLEQMFGGKQAGKTILPMMRNLDALAANFEKVADSTNYATALEDEFGSRMSNTSNIIELARNAMSNFNTMIGEPLLEPLKDALKMFLDMAKPIGDWIRNNRELVTTITKAGIVIGSAVIGFHALRAAVLFTVSPILSIYKGFLMMEKGIALVNLAMKAGFISPLGLAVGAIAAVIAAGVLLYKNWDKIKETLSGLWKSFEEKFPGMAKVIETFYENSVKPVVDGLKTAFQGVIDFVSGVFSGNWEKAWNGVKSVFTGIWDAIAAYIKIPLNAVISAINTVIRGINKFGSFTVPDWIPGIGGKGFKFDFNEIPKLAQGGIVSSPTTALVGEGREPEAVMPLSRLSQMMGAGLGSVSVNFAPVINISGGGASMGSDIRTALEAGRDDFMREFERFINNQRRISFS